MFDFGLLGSGVLMDEFIFSWALLCSSDSDSTMELMGDAWGILVIVLLVTSESLVSESLYSSSLSSDSEPSLNVGGCSTGLVCGVDVLQKR